VENWHHSMDFYDLKKEQIGASNVLGGSSVIWLRFGYVLVHITSYATLLLWPDSTMSSWRTGLAKIGVRGRYFWVCRCQNKVQGPRDRGNIVERNLDRFRALGTVRFNERITQNDFYTLP